MLKKLTVLTTEIPRIKNYVYDEDWAMEHR